MAETKINGREFRSAPLPAKEAVALYVDLNRLAGHAKERLPALMFQAVDEDNAPVEKSTLTQLVAFAGLSDILDATSTPEVIALLERIIRAAEIRRPSGDYSQCDFDGDFTGEYLKDIMPVVRWIIGEQFRDFFTASGANGILGIVQAVLPTSK